MAYDQAKCGRNEIGDPSGKVFKDSKKEDFHGMSVEIAPVTGPGVQST